MSEKQRKLLLVGIAVAGFMGVFPPWTDRFFLDSGSSGSLQAQGPCGYSFILDPPQAKMFHTVAIDVGRLVVQWAVVAIAVGGGLVFLREPSEPGSL